MKIEKILKGVTQPTAEDFEESSRRTIEILKKEPKIIFLANKGKLVVVGDLHGDLKSILKILKNFWEPQEYLLFLGDYGDRGEYSIEVYSLIFKLKTAFPSQVFLLRGNHEPLPFLIPFPHELPLEIKERFLSEKPYRLLQEFWETLSLAAVLKGKYLFLHGGLPTGLKSIKDLQKRENLEEILWNDPIEGIPGAFLSPRGAGRIFGKNITEQILKKIKIKTLIRSHQMSEGTMVHHNGKILTLFSTNTPPYRNEKRAILKIDLEKPAKDAFSLAKKAIFF